MSRTFTHRLLAGAAICVATMAALPAAAWAHVDAEGSASGDGVTKVEFSFTHGCGDSPTNALRIQLPTGATDVKPEDPTGWTSKVTATELDWNGGPAANGTKTTFEVTMKLTGKDGDVVFFPTIQACVVGENTWIDKSEDPEAENAAPRITLGAEATGGEDHDNAGTSTTEKAGVEDHDKAEPGTTAKATTTTVKATGTTAAATGTTAKAVSTDPASSTSSSSNTPLIIGGIVVLVLVVAGGGFALSKRGSSST